MSRKVRIGVMALLAVAVMAFLVGCEGPKSGPKKSVLEESLANISASDRDATEGEVANFHERMNDMVGWGHWRRFTDKSGWRAAEFEWTQLQNDIEDSNGLVARAREVSSKVESESLKQDLEAFARALELASETKEVNLLKFAHRIVHDLDYWLFKHGDRNPDYWGVTATLEGENSPVTKFLDADSSASDE